MARRRFFVDEVRNQHAELLGDEARHLSQVLRVEKGHRYELSDNREVWLAEVELARKERVVFRTIEKLPVLEPLARVVLYVALIRFEKFEWIIEKATELGVESITPVETARIEHGLERAAEKRIVRWRRIALEASQQARRARLPEIHPAIGFSDAVAMPLPNRLFLDESRTGSSIPGALPEPDRQQPVGMLIGPEGGWTDAERSQAIEAGWTAVSLGPYVLRAETAAIAALAILNSVYQRS